MLTEALAALASTGGTALVTAMVTDGWEGTRVRFARLMGRGDVVETRNVDAQLEQSAATLAASSASELPGMQAEQAVVWRTRLEDLLMRDPSAAPELSALVAEVHGEIIGTSAQVTQYTFGFGRAQQAVQGQGVQNNNFGREYRSDNPE